MCYFCQTKLRPGDDKRPISPNNYKKFGIDNDKPEETTNQNICQACRFSNNMKLGRNSCSAPGCSTSQHQIGRLYKPPLASFNQDLRCQVLEDVGIQENSKICKKCYHKVLAKGKHHKGISRRIIAKKAK